MNHKAKKCKVCRQPYQPFNTLQKCCTNPSCMIEIVRAAKSKQYDAKTKEMKAAVVPTRNDLYDKLQKLVNQYVLHIRDKDKPCCTCGKTSDVKYDAGHFYSRGGHKELRFELTNIHKQCSVNCNQHASGARVEYTEFIVRTYGQDHADWLKGPHPLLKDKFPHTDDILTEISRYRALIRENGLKPRV